MIDGTMKCKKVISATVSTKSKIDISINTKAKITCELKAAGSVPLPFYNGDYIVTPMAGSETTLETKNKAMHDDILVKKIPVYEVANLSGGNTVVIGGEFDYNG